MAPSQQEEDLDSRLISELQHFGVVTQIVVRLDPSDTAWVKFVDICASAQVGTCAYSVSKPLLLKTISHSLSPHHAGAPHSFWPKQ